MDRSETLNKIHASRARLEAALAQVTPDQQMAPDLPAGWSVRDMLAHLGRWERHALDIYQALVHGQAPDSPMNEEQVDAFNAHTMRLFHDQPFDAVRQFEQVAYHDLVRLVETMPEGDLFDPQRFPWTNGRPYLTWVGWNTYDHYPEHVQALEDRLSRPR